MLQGNDHACLEHLARYLVDEYKNKRQEDVSQNSALQILIEFTEKKNIKPTPFTTNFVISFLTLTPFVAA
jgi:hypothetical protein